MSIYIKLHTSLERYCPIRDGTGLTKIKYEEHLTVEKILGYLSLNHGEVGLVLVNGKIAREDFVLSEGETVELYPVIGGG